MTQIRSRLRSRISLALVGSLVVLAGLVPGAALAGDAGSQRYMVVFKGGYALDGTYALGKGYALVTEEQTYALDATYALGNEYALYALQRTYALLDQYALTDEYALAEDYALFGQYALNRGYALGRNYALGQGYALAQATTGYALDSSYALLDQTAGNYLGNNYALLDAYALDENYALARDYALKLISVAGGTITADLTKQIGVMIVDSRNTQFAQLMKQYALVQYVGQDKGIDLFGDQQLAVWQGPVPAAQPGQEPLEPAQWSMSQIRVGAAHALQGTRDTGNRVDVAVIDSGIDGSHQDFVKNGVSSVDCLRGADFTSEGPGVGLPGACVDNGFHGTHVAGIIGARRNDYGVVGVAPDANLIPIKICDTVEGYCYVSDAVEGITYAGDLGVDVANMSFYVDDDAFRESTMFKCLGDDTQRAFRTAVERAVAYARGEGVTMIAALGNSDTNLASDAARGGKNCKTVPAQVQGVTGVVALGPDSEKAGYSSWGAGWADVSAPGGNGTTGNCLDTVLSTIPGGWGCIQGTSMASPHTAGLAALIVGRYGVNDDGGYRLASEKVWVRMRTTVVDIGRKGYDKCFGYGRIDALRAVRNQTSSAYDATAPFCPEYTE